MRCCWRRCCGSSRSPFHDDDDARYGAVIVTSANALRGIAPHLAGSRLLKLPLFAVGEHTASAAPRRRVRQGDRGQAATPRRLRDLVLASVKTKQLKKASTLLYLAGADLARDLAGELGETRFYGGDAHHLPDGSGVQPAARSL